MKNRISAAGGSRTAFRIICSALLLLVPTGMFAAPPDGTLIDLEKAVGLLQKSDVKTTYLSSTVFDLMDGGGKKLQTTEIKERITLEPGQDPVRETLYRNTTGEDAEAASGASKQGDGNGGGKDMSVSMVLPVGEDRSSFAFGETKVKGTTASAEFGPTQAKQFKEGMTKGTLTWNTVTGKPIRLEAVPVKYPAFTSKLKFSFDFAVSGSFAYPERIEFSGEGGFLFFQRKIASVTIITDLVRQE